VRPLEGSVRFKGGREAKFQSLDLNGYSKGAASRGMEVTLGPETVYYLIER
jgi:hypothetical protein